MQSKVVQKSLPTVWVFHDREGWSDYVALLNEKHIAHAKLFTRPSECLARVQIGMGDCDVLMMHKDLGKHNLQEQNSGITAVMLIDLIHQEAPFVRVGFVSGEYPDGSKHVLENKVDFYLSTTDATKPWCINQFNKGPVSREEQEKRGKCIEEPPDEELDWASSPEMK